MFLNVVGILCSRMEERKEVLFILNNNDKIREFRRIYDKIVYKYPQIKKDFNPKFLVNDKHYKKAVEINGKIKRKSRKDNPALALNFKLICILDDYWKRDKENEKEIIIIHELGHIKYLFQIRDFSFLQYNGREFLADKYLCEIDHKLLQKKYQYWYDISLSELDNLLKEPIEHIWEIAKTFFVLKYYGNLISHQTINENIKKIKNKLIEIGLKLEVIQEFEQLIDSYLEDCNNENNLNILSKFYDENIESEILNI